MTELAEPHEPANGVPPPPTDFEPAPDRMRSASRLFVAALFGAGIVAGAMAVQSARHGWPFSLHHGYLAPGTVGARSGPPTRMKSETPVAQPRAPVVLASDRRDAYGVRIEKVRREPTGRTLRAVAAVVPDESRVSEVHTRFSGWVEQLYVNKTGQAVRAGQALGAVFSPDLLGAQNELLALKKTHTLSETLLDSTRSRLRVLGMSEAQISSVEAQGKPTRSVTVSAPRNGVVVRRTVAVGTAVDPSTELFTIADLSKIWVLAEIPERDVPDVGVGSEAKLEFSAAPDATRAAQVTFVYPTLNERTRTLRVRFELDNRRAALKPGMYGNATFETSARDALTVARDAVVDTGVEKHVFVVQEPDQYVPRSVEVGSELGDRIEIRSGVSEGESVVASGVFLIDSESRLRASGGGAAHAGHGGGAKSAEHAGHEHGAKPAPPPPRRAPATTKPAPDPHQGHSGHEGHGG